MNTAIQIAILELGLLMVGSAIYDFVKRGQCNNKRYESLFWPITKGKIVHYKIVEVNNDEGFITYNIPDIRYEYIVDGETYSSTKISYRMDTESLDNHISKYLYFVGAMVDVYYNPEKPNEAVLRPGIDKQSDLRRIVFGLVLLIIGAGCILWAILYK